MKLAVIGRGLIGSAAARHLAKQGHSVSLIGPSEPDNRADHDGVFASHYDEGRITRRLDPHPVWAELADASIARYSEIEQESGIAFFGNVGAMIAAEVGTPYMDRVEAVLGAYDALSCEGEGLEARFPYLSFPNVMRVHYEPKNAGHVSPRKLVAAQSEAARRHGAAIIDEVVTAISENSGRARIVTDKGEHFFDRVLVAAGGFSNTILPVQLDLRVLGRTVSFYELKEPEIERLRGMPSIVYRPLDGGDPYILPPIKYPNGKTYLKIGGEPEDLQLDGIGALKAWFKTDGQKVAAAYQHHTIEALIPDLAYTSVHTEACVVSYTRTGLPYIDAISECISVATGACGAGAKSSDELGRIASETLLGNQDKRFPLYFKKED